VNRRDFQKLAETRLKDAKALLRARQFDGAYYIGGYAVECALKACICKITKRYDFPSKNVYQTHYTHDFGTLVKTAGIEGNWERDCKEDSTLSEYWELVKDWKEDRRYQLRGGRGAKAAREFVLAIQGVVECLSKYW
jgi:HEPN domain-containing protein